MTWGVYGYNKLNNIKSDWQLLDPYDSLKEANERMRISANEHGVPHRLSGRIIGGYTKYKVCKLGEENNE